MVTISVIKADIGGMVGHSSSHPDILALGQRELDTAKRSGLLIDGHASHCGDDMFLIMTHKRGEDNEQIHKLAWDTFIKGTDLAKKLKLYGAGQDLLTDAFSGNIRGAGPGSAEMEIDERPSEPIIVFMGDKTSAGGFNLALYKMFADPFNTPGLVIGEPLHDGFSFEIQDVKEHQQITLNAPEELYDLLIFIGAPSRYAIKRVRNRLTGEIAACSSTDKLSLIAGRYVGKDDPTMVVRCQGSFPAVGGARAVRYGVHGRGLDARLAQRAAHAGGAEGRAPRAIRRPAAVGRPRIPARGRQAERTQRHV